MCPAKKSKKAKTSSKKRTAKKAKAGKPAKKQARKAGAGAKKQAKKGSAGKRQAGKKAGAVKGKKQKPAKSAGAVKPAKRAEAILKPLIIPVKEMPIAEPIVQEPEAKRFTKTKTVGKMEYTIVNLVASGNLNSTLDLYNLAVSIPNIEYEPEQFPGAILKLKEPKVSMLLFKNGKIICSGASTEKDIAFAITKASKLIHEVQKNVKVQKNVVYNVVNLVATANLRQTLDLFKTAMSLDNVEYEPEQFPGAILRIEDPKITLLLFKNGKVICAGAKREEYLKKGLEKAAALIKAIK